MSRTNENKLKMKDIATIGIFSALLFVVTMVAGALMGISMVLNMYSVAVVAVLSAPLYMLIMAKVHKKGAVLLTCYCRYSMGAVWRYFCLDLDVRVWRCRRSPCQQIKVSELQNAYRFFWIVFSWILFRCHRTPLLLSRILVWI